MPIPAQATCNRERGVTAGWAAAACSDSLVVQRNRSFAGHNCGRRQRAHEQLQISVQCCEAAHVRYAVLPVLVSAQLLVFLLGDFDLIISARAQYCLVRGCVTARSHHCWYDMSYGSRTHAPRWEYMYVWLLHVILRFWERCTVRTI